MKIKISVFITAVTLSASGQTSVYHPFPDSNAMWNIHGQGYAGNSCSFTDPVITDYYFSYYISGDTMINNLYYLKISSSGYAHEHCLYDSTVDNWWTWYDQYAFSYRQDLNLKKIYAYTNQEYLIYDFSLNVGDTIPDQECAVITSIDSILIGNNYRKRFNLFSSQYSIIEGIGSTSGLREPLCPFEHYGTLTCFTQDGMTLYPDGDYSCERITDISIITSKKVLADFYPNPFHLTTTLELQKEFEGSVLIIFNAFGEKIRQQNISSRTTTINRNGISNGIYFYHLTTSDGRYASGLLVIE